MSDLRPPTHAFDKQFEAPFDVGPKSFAHHYLLLASRGAFQVEAAGRQWLLPPHRAAWIHAGTPVRIRTHGPVTSASVLFDAGIGPGMPTGCSVFAVSPLAREMVHYAMKWNAGAQRPDPAADAFFAALFNVCCELAAAAEPTWLPMPQSRALQRALGFVLDRLAEEVTLDAAAAVACVSPRTLSRRFIDELGMPWQNYLTRARMIKAAQMLADPDASVTAISAGVGFSSTSAFIRAFKAFSGFAPASYQRRLLRPS